MTYPALRVHLDKIEENARSIAARCDIWGISPWGVTKGISAHPEVAAAFRRGGFHVLADSRLQNIRDMRAAGIPGPYALLRVPMLSEISELVRIADYSMVSDTKVIEAMTRACHGISHGVIMMMDMGDLREGFWYGAILSAVKEIKRCMVASDGLYIAGVGVNYACASGVLPSADSLNQFVRCGEMLEGELGHRFEIFSAGATSSLPALERGEMPSRVNNLRIGEGVLLGTDTANGVVIEGACTDTMEIEAEIVEVRRKPSLPEGPIGCDAFGNVPSFTDRGWRYRSIAAIGKQDIIISGLKPVQEGMSVITASSDHLLLDVEECSPRPQIGDIVTFRPDYPAMLSASTSKYVKKIFEI